MNGHLDIIKALLTHGKIPIDVEAKGSWDWNALHFAASSGKPSAYRVSELLIQAGTNPLSTEVDGWIPLHLAAEASNSKNNTALLQLLWEQDRNSFETRANDGRTALHFGCQRPNSLVWMLKHGAEIDVTDNKGMTALMSAANTGNDSGEAVHVLLNNGANPLLVDKRGKTALQNAAHAGGVKVGEALLTWNGDVERLVSSKDQDNCSALHIAIWDREPSFAEMLLDSFYAKATRSALKDLSAVRECNGETPLISAVKHGYKGVIKRLLALGAETEARDSNGDTALLLAVAGTGKDKLAILRLLLDPDSDNRAKVNAGGRVHPTALHQAASRGIRDVVEELLTLGANVNAVGGKYHTALTAAVYGEHTEVVEFLLENGATQVLTEGGSPYLLHPLQAAILTDNTELIPKLVEKESESVNLQDSQGRTALDIAMRQGAYEAVVKLLESKIPKLETRDKQGRGLLHHAVLSRDVDIVAMCMGWDELFKLSLNVPDLDGWTPLHWACRVDDNVEIIKELVGAEGDDALMKATNDDWTPESICAFHDSGSTKAFIDERIRSVGKDKGVADDPSSNVSEPGDMASKDEPSKSPEPKAPPEESEESPEPTKPADPDATQKNTNTRRWKVGYRDPSGMICDGCFISVSLALTNCPGRPSHIQC
jgi:ankyrin repeat protein